MALSQVSIDDPDTGQLIGHFRIYIGKTTKKTSRSSNGLETFFCTNVNMRLKIWVFLPYIYAKRQKKHLLLVVYLTKSELKPSFWPIFISVKRSALVVFQLNGHFRIYIGKTTKKKLPGLV